MFDLSTQEGRNELAATIAQSFQIADVSLVIANQRDRQSFLSWFVPVLNATIVSTWSPYPCSAFLETLDRFDYLFLVIEHDFPDDLYLLVRDYALNRNADLKTRFGTYTIHPDHRLVVFIGSESLNRLTSDLRRVLNTLCMVKYVSADPTRPPSNPDEIPMTDKGFQIFADIESAVHWCEHYYSSRVFFFRGQSEDWPLTSTLQRAKSQEDFERLISRTENFIDWLMNHPDFEEMRDNVDKAMAVAQHFGLPTNLLDLSRTPQAAGFFAAHKPPNDLSRLGVIYVFSQDEWEHHPIFEGGGSEYFGKGLVLTEIATLRRLRHQQGLFVEAHPMLLHDYSLTKLYFHHRPPGIDNEETTFLPREFIFPPPSPLEREVYTYLLVEAASGGRVDPTTPLPTLPAVSFDLGGYIARAYLDQMSLAKGLPTNGTLTSLDSFAGLITLSASHLLVAVNAYLLHVFEFVAAQAKGELTPEFFSAWRPAVRAVQYHLCQSHKTDITAIPELSIRDLVDCLALYHNIRSANPTFASEQFEAALGERGARLWLAYRYADHWLGEEAMEGFPITAAFALRCDRPIHAFMAAVQEYGRHGGGFLVDYSTQEIDRYLTWWTGYEVTSIDAVRKTIRLTPFLERRLARLEALQKSDNNPVDHLNAAFLYRLHSIPLMQEVCVQFAKRADGKIILQKHDEDLVELMAHVDQLRSVAEGLTSLDTTMLCEHTECPYHRFRICGRVAVLPEDFHSCKFKAILEAKELSSEALDSLKAAP